MNIILFDDQHRNQLLPLTFLRPVADIRVGITTIREKWEDFFQTKTSSLTEEYLSEKFPFVSAEDNILINGSVLPNEDLIKEIKQLKNRDVLSYNQHIVAIRLIQDDFFLFGEIEDWLNKKKESPLNQVEAKSSVTILSRPWEVFTLNSTYIQQDFQRLTKGRKSASISDTNTVICKENVFIEEGAIVNASILNATDGPIYIGKDAQVMEGSMLRGSLAVCEHVVIKMGAKIYGGTTIGPWCKVGGEVSNSVLLGYSNKAHDGFLGNSVLAEWCNLGADTNTSNLKNTYDSIKLYDYTKSSFQHTGETFIGLIMGDHSKSGINTMFNSGTVVGVNANVFGSGYQRNFIPSFSWGGRSGLKFYDFNKAMEVAKAVYKRRNLTFDEVEQKILSAVHRKEMNNK